MVRAVGSYPIGLGFESLTAHCNRYVAMSAIGMLSVADSSIKRRKGETLIWQKQKNINIRLLIMRDILRIKTVKQKRKDYRMEHMLPGYEIPEMNSRQRESISGGKIR